jgi:uncharacterized phage protein gp47/JayE
MSEVTLASLVTIETQDAIYAKHLVVLQSLGEETESWKSGDPTRSQLDAISRFEASKEKDVAASIASGFLDLAEGDGLTLCARGLGTERIKATYATCTWRLTNTGPEPFIFDPNDLIAASNDGQTYRSSTGGTLAAGGTLDVTIIAEIAGSESSAGIGDITTMVTAFPKVSATNITSAVGLDEESDPALRIRAKAKFGANSPNGPADAYSYVATTPDRVGGAQITRTRVIDDSTVGEVEVYIAGPSGAVDSETVDLVEIGLEKWANPLCNELTVTSATNKTIPVTYQLWVYESISEEISALEDLIEAALLAAITTRPIGGDIIPPALTGFVYQGWIESVILAIVGPKAFRVAVSLPAGDVACDIDDVPVLGTVTPTITLVEDP